MNATTDMSGISEETATLDLNVRVEILEDGHSDVLKRVENLESIYRKIRSSGNDRNPTLDDRVLSAKLTLAGTSGLTPRQLRQELDVSSSYCSQIIAELKGEGYVEEPNPRDHRSKIIKPPEMED